MANDSHAQQLQEARRVHLAKLHAEVEALKLQEAELNVLKCLKNVFKMSEMG